MGVTRRDMLGAYAYHLKTTYGYSISDLAAFLQYKRSENVMRLIESYRALELEGKAEETGGFVEL